MQGTGTQNDNSVIDEDRDEDQSQIQSQDDSEQNQTDLQTDNELIGQSSQSQKISDVKVTKILKLLTNREGKWYQCLFSDGLTGFIHAKHKYTIPQEMRDAYHEKYTWTNKRKSKRK